MLDKDRPTDTKEQKIFKHLKNKALYMGCIESTTPDGVLEGQLSALFKLWCFVIPDWNKGASDLEIQSLKSLCSSQKLPELGMSSLDERGTFCLEKGRHCWHCLKFNSPPFAAFKITF